MFIGNCCIEEYSSGLIEKIKELGYFITFSARNNYGKYLFCCNGLCTKLDVKSIGDWIFTDCINNEMLFLAIAALRDDNDFGQWFICDDNESMFLVDKPNMTMKEYIYNYMGWDTSGARKATIEELIEHFKL